MDQASRAVRLVDRGQFKSIRQVSRATGAARSTVQDRRTGRQPRGQEEVKHARLTRYQEEVLAKYIRDTQLQYAPVNREQLHVVAEMLAQLNEPNARLGKNWLSRFLNRHSDLKTSRNRELDSKRITAESPARSRAGLLTLTTSYSALIYTPRTGATWMRLVTNSAIAKTSSLYSIDVQEPLYHWQVVQQAGARFSSQSRPLGIR